MWNAWPSSSPIEEGNEEPTHRTSWTIGIPWTIDEMPPAIDKILRQHRKSIKRPNWDALDLFIVRGFNVTPG